MDVDDFNDPDELYRMVTRAMMTYNTGNKEYTVKKLEYRVEYEFFKPYVWMEIMDYPNVYWGIDKSQGLQHEQE